MKIPTMESGKDFKLIEKIMMDVAGKLPLSAIKIKEWKIEREISLVTQSLRKMAELKTIKQQIGHPLRRPYHQINKKTQITKISQLKWDEE